MDVSCGGKRVEEEDEEEGEREERSGHRLVVVNFSFLFLEMKKERTLFGVLFSLDKQHYTWVDCTRNSAVGVNYNTQDENNE